MKKKIKLGEHTKYIFKQLCITININATDIDFNGIDWQDEYSWTFEQEVDFQQWLASYLTANPAAIIQLRTLPELQTQDINKMVRRFTLFYGWALTSCTESSLKTITEQEIN